MNRIDRYEGNPDSEDRSRDDWLKAARMTRELEDGIQKSPESSPPITDLSHERLSGISNIESFASKIIQAQRAPQYGVEQYFDLALELLQPEPGASPYYEIYRNSASTSMADSFLKSLPGLNLDDLRGQLDRTWGAYIFGGDQGAFVSVAHSKLPEWLTTRLNTLRDNLGSDYAVEVVAHRQAGKSSSELSVGLRIEYVAALPERLANDQKPDGSPESTTATSPLVRWERQAQQLKERGFSEQEIRIERELRERVDIAKIIESLESQRDSLLRKKEHYANKFGNIEVAEVSLAKLKVELPKTSTLAVVSATGGAVYLASLCLSGFNHDIALQMSAALSPVWGPGAMIATDTYSRRKLNQFHPWERSPHLKELGEALTERGFVWELEDKTPYDNSQPMALNLKVFIRDRSIQSR